MTVNREGHRPIIIESQSDDEADGANVVVGLVEEEVEAEDLSDVSSSDSDAHFYSDLSDSDAVDGEPGAYYGGYGHCYRCGKGFSSVPKIKSVRGSAQYLLYSVV
jgi:hypothetical protein